MNDNINVSIGDMLRANPVGAAMIGMGLFWMLAGARTGEAMFGAARAMANADLPLSPSRMAESASGMASAVGDAARHGASAMSEDATALWRGQPARNAFAAMETMRDSLGNLFAAQPLMIAATGLAVGAAIAASLPATDVEARTLGGLAEDLKQNATEFASDAAQSARSTLSDLASSAQQKAEGEGITPDTIAEKAADAARGVGKDAGLI